MCQSFPYVIWMYCKYLSVSYSDFTLIIFFYHFQWLLWVSSFYVQLNSVLMAGLRSLCLAINKSLWITGKAGSQCSCVHVWAGQRNDWSSGGLRARKNAVRWDCRLGVREGRGPRYWQHGTKVQSKI